MKSENETDDASVISKPKTIADVDNTKRARKKATKKKD